jgi:GNAT superfamily N-acetyltransferase
MVQPILRSPRVASVSAEQQSELTMALDRWRGTMPGIGPNILSSEGVMAFAAFEGEQIVGGYLLASIPMANEIHGLAVDPQYRRQGLGRLLCMDALFRSGKRPLVLTVNDESTPFAKAVGFKIIGKRKQADGTFLTRVGWHAPRPSEVGAGNGTT